MLNGRGQSGTEKPEGLKLEEQRSSWVDTDSENDEHNLEYLRDQRTATSASSPFTPASYGRPRAPTPSASVTTQHDDLWSPPPNPVFLSPLLPNGIYNPDSPLSISPPPSTSPPASAIRSPNFSMPIIDPSQFPDPYPVRSGHRQPTSTPPPLSSAGSSSTRSSAYTSSTGALASGDYGHINVFTGDEEPGVNTGLASDSFMQKLASEAPPPSRALPTRAPVERWAEAYSSSTSIARSRSSSIGNGNSNGTVDNSSVPRLHEKPSYDTAWQPADEREEIGLSEDETDDEHYLAEVNRELEEKEEERTSAVVIAEEGRGLIVHGENTPVFQLNVQPGTTHLLVSQSSTPNSMPTFLMSNLPRISVTLLALDISNNFLNALPPVLAGCLSLEELNVANNPLRVLPVFLADLGNLRVLIADSTGITTLPDSLAELDRLHTLSIRKNKMYSLPSWLCLLPVLQTLCVDDNPFQGPWRALVEPLLTKMPMTPMYPPSTPMLPLPSASVQSQFGDAEGGDHTDIEDELDSPSPGANAEPNWQDEESTLTPDRAPFLNRSTTVPAIPASPAPSAALQSRPLTRTRTTPNRAYFNQSRVKSSAPSIEPSAIQAQYASRGEEQPVRGDHEIRKMKSAGDLRRGKSAPTTPGDATPSRPPLTHYPGSHSTTNLNATASPTNTDLSNNKRFASLSSASSVGSPTRGPSNPSRPALTKSLWDSISESEDESTKPNRDSIVQPNPPVPTSHQSPPRTSGEGSHPTRQRSGTKDSKDKGTGRWGFLKKMSMGKIKADVPPVPPIQHPNRPPQPARPHTSAGSSTSGSVIPSKSPQIDVRFSTTGTLGPMPTPSYSNPPSPPQPEQKLPQDLLKPAPALSSPSLLAPPTPQPRSAKRRSFLPINDAPATLNIPIPDSSKFVPGVIAHNDADESVEGRATSSATVTEVSAVTTPIITETDQYIRREEERAREAYMRALRSVMAYLKDMNDLAMSQQGNPLSMYGGPDDVAGGTTRPRRPTGVDAPREVSMALSGSTLVDGAPSHLRSAESMAGLRSGGAAQTLSVATTDSTGSNEERKYKDDKGKRAMVVKEIVITERTYVKGLQELVDIYIKPASVQVNLLSGVGSSKDTVVPAAERKVVFGGIEALFSFHRDSFLPALEQAAAPLMDPKLNLQQADPDGKLSLQVVRAVASMFLKHAAFMKMYSTYINNFDNSVQRVKHWSSDRSNGTVTPATTISPASSTVQLASIGLAISAISADPAGATGLPNLTSNQRRRIKSYLKRCRMNPHHSQLNLEGYLLLPVQRIPRYRLLLEELMRSTPPMYDYVEDPLERALAEISSLANNMNEGKREAESRRKLVQWQARIRGKFPSPLVQPHRRLIMDGPLLLTRVVRKSYYTFEAINAQGDASTVQVDCLLPELTPRPLIGILCNDLLVLCRDTSDGQDPNSAVDLWAVLRMQTLPQPASIVHGNSLRLVDNKAILYFDAPSPSDALNWYRAINLHIPASKS
ncbi:hypothetical protein AX16_005525 [Volvariella volvacea WC 439]|nr:hypothetical protein AX16_005525 [Volvariella volvacea WC 439]